MVIRRIREILPGCSIEVLIPDFKGSLEALKIVMDARPEILNHNVETVPRLFKVVQPQDSYDWAAATLSNAKKLDPEVLTKSGIMVGLGEERNEILQLMDDLRSADVDFMTIGQYLQPTRKHHPVIRFVTPDEFKSFETIGKTKGFLLVASSPLTRSSHHAGDDFAKLKAAREALAAPLERDLGSVVGNGDRQAFDVGDGSAIAFLQDALGYRALERAARRERKREDDAPTAVCHHQCFHAHLPHAFVPASMGTVVAPARRLFR